jgi:molybdate transport system ATP-binding protein
MQLEKLANAFPATLSGGQKQRVALARALVRTPKLLLLDEPMTALDPTLRSQIQALLREVHQKYGLTTLMISHDVGDIYSLADRVVTLDAGTIVRDGTPDQVFLDPRNSGKFQVTGRVLKIEREDIVYVVTVQTGNQVVRVVALANDVEGLSPGDVVLVSSKAFNPVLIRING